MIGLSKAAQRHSRIALVIYKCCQQLCARVFQAFDPAFVTD